MNIKIIDGMPILNQNDIKHLLPKTFDKSSISEINEIKPLNKNDFVRKRCYRLVLNNSEAIHLTCGYDLKNVFEKRVEILHYARLVQKTSSLSKWYFFY